MITPGYTILERRQTWRRHPTRPGEFWRECVARRHSDGELRLILVDDEGEL